MTGTGYLVLSSQIAFIPHITDIANAGRNTRNGLVLASFQTADFKVCWRQGILGILAYGFAFVGAITFMQFSLYRQYACQANTPADRSSTIPAVA
jgi:hypothetical protein